MTLTQRPGDGHPDPLPWAGAQGEGVSAARDSKVAIDSKPLAGGKGSWQSSALRSGAPRDTGQGPRHTVERGGLRTGTDVPSARAFIPTAQHLCSRPRDPRSSADTTCAPSLKACLGAPGPAGEVGQNLPSSAFLFYSGPQRPGVAPFHPPPSPGGLVLSSQLTNERANPSRNSPRHTQT